MATLPLDISTTIPPTSSASSYPGDATVQRTCPEKSLHFPLDVTFTRSIAFFFPQGHWFQPSLSSWVRSPSYVPLHLTSFHCRSPAQQSYQVAIPTSESLPPSRLSLALATMDSSAKSFDTMCCPLVCKGPFLQHCEAI